MSDRDIQNSPYGADITERMLQERIVAIFRGYTGELANRAAEALVAGGIRFMEVTMNTEQATAIISHGVNDLLDGLILVQAQWLMWPRLVKHWNAGRSS